MVIGAIKRGLPALLGPVQDRLDVQRGQARSGQVALQVVIALHDGGAQGLIGGQALGIKRRFHRHHQHNQPDVLACKSALEVFHPCNVAGRARVIDLAQAFPGREQPAAIAGDHCRRRLRASARHAQQQTGDHAGNRQALDKTLGVEGKDHGATWSTRPSKRGA
ncbi:hypothetical protein D3C85_1089820 [compost metagenome]